MKDLLKSHRVWIILIAGFVVFLAFFDSDNLLDRFEMYGRIGDLEQQRDYFRQRISEDSTLLGRLKNDLYLEQYAREHFLMKREGETIYFIEE